MPTKVDINLEQEIKQLFSNVTGISIEKLKTDANLWQELGIDSIKAIEITVAIEKKFKIRVRDEQIPEIATISDAIRIIGGALEKKQNEKKQ